MTIAKKTLHGALCALAIVAAGPSRAEVGDSPGARPPRDDSRLSPDEERRIARTKAKAQEATSAGLLKAARDATVAGPGESDPPARPSPAKDAKADPAKTAPIPASHAVPDATADRERKVEAAGTTSVATTPAHEAESKRSAKAATQVADREVERERRASRRAERRDERRLRVAEARLRREVDDRRRRREVAAIPRIEPRERGRSDDSTSVTLPPAAAMRPRGRVETAGMREPPPAPEAAATAPAQGRKVEILEETLRTRTGRILAVRTTTRITDPRPDLCEDCDGPGVGVSVVEARPSRRRWWP